MKVNLKMNIKKIKKYLCIDLQDVKWKKQSANLYLRQVEGMKYIGLIE